jgi:hypothetical protein
LCGFLVAFPFSRIFDNTEVLATSTTILEITSMSTSMTDENTTTVDKNIRRNILQEMDDISIERATKMKVDVLDANNTDQDLILGMDDTADNNKDKTVRNGRLQRLFSRTIKNSNHICVGFCNGFNNIVFITILNSVLTVSFTTLSVATPSIGYTVVICLIAV